MKDETADDIAKELRLIREELQKLTMLVIFLLLLFTFCFYLSVAVTGSPTR